VCVVDVTDIALMEYLRENMRDDQIFFIASQDEASYSYAHLWPVLATVLLLNVLSIKQLAYCVEND